tara:strand:- start:42 stop:1148 length:1107 start_codon:yes stop_codon:yes gene_type:complete
LRISLLEKRENFYKILFNTLVETSFVKKEDHQQSLFYINKYLNYVASPSIKTSSFDNIFNEYYRSKFFLRAPFQYIYVYLAIRNPFRRLLSTSSISLPKSFENYIIMGGNHRIRLFSSDLKTSIVILKRGEDKKFIQNDMITRFKYGKILAPNIIEYGENWIKEECFKGRPLNRLRNKAKIENLKEDIYRKHFKSLIEPSSQIIEIEDYKSMIFNDLSRIKNILDKNFSSSIFIHIKNLFNHLFRRVSKKTITISLTHGDFQGGNILVNGEESTIIDWESSDKRYYLYDLFTFFCEPRKSNFLKNSFNIFFDLTKKSDLFLNLKKDNLFLMIIEELRFILHEEVGENYNINKRKILDFCEELYELTNE